MRLVVDALAARHGGLATYVRGLLRGWSEAAPQDRITVLATGPFGELIAADPGCANHEFRVFASRDPATLWRLVRTEFLLPEHQRNADALLATMPTIPLAWRKPVAIVVHDLRHDDRPQEFSARQRLARRIFYTHAYRRADSIVAISQRVADDLITRNPLISERVSVALHGSDHVAEWQSTRTGDAVAFGHHANKEPRLLLSTWKHLTESCNARVPTLHVIGLDEPHRTELLREATRLGIRDRVMLDPYIPDHQLEQLMRSASALLFPSRHEGFGLPVLEAMRQGVPVVISPDRALHEVAGGFAAEANGWSPAQLATAVRSAIRMTTRDINLARDYANQFTWRRSAQITRAAIVATLRP
ncbi:MAG TPA: glycosyltransferase family 1 protein [Candidatus Acidoferrum sp.]|jgi:glycosyltransferase involved in cell wall biosynthesis|nr:glycosyltransferase family 1 protein [Candidatus Acidoferrum sp.]